MVYTQHVLAIQLRSLQDILKNPGGGRRFGKSKHLSLSNKVLLGMYYTRELGSSQALSTLKLVGTMGGYQTPFDGLSLFTRRLGCSMNLERG